MNIFYTSDCPIECARYLDDKRVVKMCLETAQMLSTALREYCAIDDALYKSTHRNHPCNIWVRECQANYEWTVEHFKALCSEYTKRYGKVHASYTRLSDVFDYYILHEPFMNNGGKTTTFPNCAGNDSLNISYKHMKDTKQAYKLYLSDRWSTDKKKPTWSK